MPEPAGHYFDAEPRCRRPPPTVRLDLPDLSLTLATDRGVFSADRVDPGTKYLLLEAPSRRPPARCVDLGCGYGADRLHPGPPRARRDGVGRRRERAGPPTSAGQRRRLRPRQRPGRGARGRARRPGRRPALVEPADPHRQGRPARPPRSPGSAGWPRPAAPCSWCRSTSAATRSSAGSESQGWTTERLGSARGLPSCSRCASVKQLDRHRPEAAPPRAGVGAPTDAWRSCSTTCRGRSTSAPSSARRRPCGSTTCGWPAAPPTPTTPRSARRRSAPSATSPSTEPRTGALPWPLPGPPATRWWPSSWPTGADPLHELSLGAATCLVVGHEDRGCSPGALEACDARGLPPAARPGRLAERGHRRVHRLLRGAPPGLGQLPADQIGVRALPYRPRMV